MLAEFGKGREWFRVHPFVAVAVIDHLATGEPSAELLAKIVEWAKLEAIPFREDRFSQYKRRLVQVEDEIMAEWPMAKDMIIRL
jgi:hypothetical protein